MSPVPVHADCTVRELRPGLRLESCGVLHGAPSELSRICAAFGFTKSCTRGRVFLTAAKVARLPEVLDSGREPFAGASDPALTVNPTRVTGTRTVAASSPDEGASVTAGRDQHFCPRCGAGLHSRRVSRAGKWGPGGLAGRTDWVDYLETGELHIEGQENCVGASPGSAWAIARRDAPELAKAPVDPNAVLHQALRAKRAGFR
jgi:hypothetical protein